MDAAVDVAILDDRLIDGTGNMEQLIYEVSILLVSATIQYINEVITHNATNICSSLYKFQLHVD